MTGRSWAAVLWAAFVLPVGAEVAPAAFRLADGPAEPAPRAAQSLLLALAVHREEVFAVGERGHLLVSSDGGRTWAQRAMPTRRMLTAVAFAPGGDGWITAHGSQILRSKDGGRSWSVVHRGPDADAPLFDIAFARGGRVGLAVGAFGQVWRSADGGDGWSAVDLGDDPHLNAVVEGPDGRWYVAAEGGRVWTASPPGEDWTELELPYHGSLHGILALENGRLLAFGLRGTIWESLDDGQQWAALPSPSASLLLRGRRLADGRLALAGMDGRLLAGRTGRDFVAGPDLGLGPVSDFLELPGGDLIVVGERGVRRFPRAVSGS